ncbi:MAG: hypothetical protein JWM78_2122 [Verrucomicrobiaceae bacterium]|nr:hypothetical protein [Verrucomicrobiaceae bacterium]
MQQIVQTIRQIARHEVEQHWHPCLAVVKTLHTTDDSNQLYACTVQLRETGLVLPKVPIATSVTGAAALPRENDLVIVLFLGGDAHAPVVIGRLYNEIVAPPNNKPGEWVTVLPGDETGIDKRVELRVNTPGDGSRDIQLKLGGDVEIAININDGGIELKAQDTTFKLTQSSSSDGKAELKVGDSSVIVEQGGDIKIEASGTLTLKANKIEISGDTSVKVAGQTIDLN